MDGGCFSLVMLGSERSFKILNNFFYILQRVDGWVGVMPVLRIVVDGWMGGYGDRLGIATGV